MKTVIKIVIGVFSALKWCRSNTCHNGATCVDGDSGFTCDCSTGFVGRHCETESLTTGNYYVTKIVVFCVQNCPFNHTSFLN